MDGERRLFARVNMGRPGDTRPFKEGEIIRRAKNPDNTTFPYSTRSIVIRPEDVQTLPLVDIRSPERIQELREIDENREDNIEDDTLGLVVNRPTF